MALPIAPISANGEVKNIHYTLLEWLTCSSKVARIFSPNASQARLYRIVGGNLEQSNSIALGEAIPMRTILLRAIDRGAEPGVDGACD